MNFIILGKKICNINFCFGPFEIHQFKTNYGGLKID